ncbi:MAG: thiamine pyrophosphokinase [Marinoscillum sp.]
MSSHHIVRDEQEPALILHRLEGFLEPNLHSLLEWSPTVISCEPAIEKFTSLGHKLDVALIGLGNFEYYRSLLSEQLPVKLIAVHNQDFLMTAMTILQKENYKAVNVVTQEEGVFEVTQLIEQWLTSLDIVIYTEKQRILFVKAKTFKKWLPANSKLIGQSMGELVSWTTSGFEEEFNNQESYDLELVKKQEGEVTISCSQSPFLVIEEL